MQQSDNPIVDCVSLANYLAHKIGFGLMEGDAYAVLPDGVLDRVGLDGGAALTYAKEMGESIAEAVKVLSA